jgi:3-deoxy-D-manno-octulosonic-acid transferase
MSWRRVLYTAASSLLLPLIPLRLWWRGRREPGYREHIGERFGFFGGAARPLDVWVHAVSAGETRAATPLVRALRERIPGVRILLTHMTATGREAGRTLFGDSVVQAYLPYDLPFAVRRFFRHFQPQVGLIMETELWPNLIALAREARVPVYLVNARLSERSGRRYARLAGLSRETLCGLAGIGAQAAADEARLRALGARAVTVTGSMKFDVDVPGPMLERGRGWRTLWGRHRLVWLAASTREGEEELLVEILDRLPDGVLTIIVPRHPQRFDAVANLLAGRRITCSRRSAGLHATAEARVMLGDSMGEMFAYYAAADVAFIGGSLLPFGGQNLLEACAAGTPVVLGPHTFNFSASSDDAVAAGAALRVQDADELAAALTRLLRDPALRARMSAAGLAFYGSHGGATRRTLALIAPALEGISRRSASG